MFSLKLALAVVVIFFLLYNGASIFSSDKSGLQKTVEFSLYAIIVMIVANFIFSVITYYQTKPKIGQVGDKGIRGQQGDKGNKGKCEEKCGIKVCIIDLTNTANTTFYLELEKIYGGVMLQYNLKDSVNENAIVDKIWNKIYSNHRISIIKRENREKFNKLPEAEQRKTILDLLKIYATYSPDKKRLYIRIHAGQDLGKDLRLRISRNREYFKFKNIVPELVLQEDNLDFLNACLADTINRKIVKLDEIEPSTEKDAESAGVPELGIYNCDKAGEIIEKSGDGEDEDDKESDEDAIPEGRVPKDTLIRPRDLRKLKIRNEFFINKIRSICNSPEYQEILEIDVDNRPNEKRLIEFLSENVTRWVRRLMNFTYIDEKGELSYGGMRFLLTREADINVFDDYLSSESYIASFSKTELINLNPINELKKYDTWNWNQPYTNVPLVFEKCDVKQPKATGLEPKISIVKTNNYKKIYDTRVKNSKWYSTDKYCPFNQLGEFNENPKNVKECIFYDTNSQGHDYLEGRQPAWKSVEYTKPKSLAFYHPVSKPSNEIQEPTPAERDIIKNEYYRDEQGRYYYPLGSIWSGLIVDENQTRKDANKFSPNSRETGTGNTGNGPEKETVLVTGDVVDPIDYIKIWNSRGDGEGCLDCQEEEATIWRPVPPEGYICLGDVVTKGNIKPDPNKTALIKCVPISCVVKIPLGQKVWDSDSLVKKVYAQDNETSEDSMHPLHKFYIKLADNFEKIDFNNFNTFRIMRPNLEEIIDDLISEEEKKSRIERKNSNYYKNPFSSELNIKKLNAFKNSAFMQNWPIPDITALNNYTRNKKDLYILKNKISGVISKILTDYSDKYMALREKGASDFNSSKLMKSTKSTKINFDGKVFNMSNYESNSIKPIMSSSKPVNIYSAGASKNNMEKSYRLDLNIKDDGGHNLFLADNEGNIKKPEFAYKLKRQCFQSIQGKPIETNAVAGTLSNIKRNNENIKSAEKYFTFPMNILITSELGNARSPNGNPKRYYLTLVKTIKDKATGVKTPIYIIRTMNKRDKKYSNCIGIFEGTLVSATINTSYKGNFWTCENIDTTRKNIVPDNIGENVVIRLKSYNEPDKLFSHSYDFFGKGTETIKSGTEALEDKSCQWKSEKIRD